MKYWNICVNIQQTCSLQRFTFKWVFSFWLTAMIRIPPPPSSIKKRKFQETPYSNIPVDFNTSGISQISIVMLYRYHMSENIIANMIHVLNQYIYSSVWCLAQLKTSTSIIHSMHKYIINMLTFLSFFLNRHWHYATCFHHLLGFESHKENFIRSRHTHHCHH